MLYKIYNDIIIVRLEKNEEIIGTIKEVCEKENITLGYITGLGAVNYVNLGLFVTEEKKYYTKQCNGDFEITALIGNISTKEKKVYLHMHITIANVLEGKIFGGHLNEAIVSATAEIFIHIMRGTIERRFDEQVGLNIINL